MFDNCSSHCVDVKCCREQIEIFTKTIKCSSIHQAMDIGAILTWKKIFQSLLLGMGYC